MKGITLKDIFTKGGYFKHSWFDPYCHESGKDKRLDSWMEYLFDDGNLKSGVSCKIQVFVIHNKKTIQPLSDVVRLYMASEFAMNTKGNYSAIYMWR